VAANRAPVAEAVGEVEVVAEVLEAVGKDKAEAAVNMEGVAEAIPVSYVQQTYKHT